MKVTGSCTVFPIPTDAAGSGSLSRKASGYMNRLATCIDQINIAIGKVTSFIILPLVIIIMIEVLCRHFFNAPTTWANEMVQYLLVAVAMLGGGYCYAADEHVRVDIIYHRLSKKGKAVVEVLTFFAVMSAVIAIVGWGGELCYDALIHWKRSSTILEFPLFPSMVLVPIGALLIGLQGFSRGLRAVMTLMGVDPTQQKKED